MLNKDFIQRKITLIQEDLGNFSGFAQYSFDEIARDYVKQAAVERFLERAVNRAIDINQHLIAELATEKNKYSAYIYRYFFKAGRFWRLFKRVC